MPDIIKDAAVIPDPWPDLAAMDPEQLNASGLLERDADAGEKPVAVMLQPDHLLLQQIRFLLLAHNTNLDAQAYNSSKAIRKTSIISSTGVLVRSAHVAH